MTLELPSPSIVEAARRVWRGMATGAGTTDEMAAVAERTLTELGLGLRRWIGGEGYRVLLDRAVRTVIVDHPVLGELACREGDPPVVASRLETHGAEAIAEGMVALVATVTQVLGRIIGEDMAIHLVEQLDTVNLKVVAATRRDEGFHDE